MLEQICQATLPVLAYWARENTILVAAIANLKFLALSEVAVL
jgi:hypothetical protein